MNNELSNLELGVFMGEVRQQLVDIKKELDLVRNDVRTLKDFRMKMIGMGLGVSLFTGIIGSFIGLLLQRLL